MQKKNNVQYTVKMQVYYYLHVHFENVSCSEGTGNSNQWAMFYEKENAIKLIKPCHK